MPTVPVTWTRNRRYFDYLEYPYAYNFAVPDTYRDPAFLFYDIQRAWDAAPAVQSGTAISRASSSVQVGPLPSSASGVSFEPEFVPGGQPSSFAGSVTFPDSEEWQGIQFSCTYYTNGNLAIHDDFVRSVWTCDVRPPGATFVSVAWLASDSNGHRISFRVQGGSQVPDATIEEFQVRWSGFTDTLTPVLLSGRTYYADWEHAFTGEDTPLMVRCRDSLGMYSPWRRLYLGPVIDFDIKWRGDNWFTLDAAKSWDLDGHITTYEWRVYPLPPSSVINPPARIFTSDLVPVPYNANSGTLPPATFTGKTADLNLEEYKLTHPGLQGVNIDLRVIDNDGYAKTLRRAQQLYTHTLALVCDRFGGELSIFESQSPNGPQNTILKRYVTSTLAEGKLLSGGGINPSLWHSDGPAGTQLGLASQGVALDGTPTGWRRYKTKDYFRTTFGGDIVWTNEYGFADFSGTINAIDITAAIKLETREIWFKHETESGWSEPVLVGVLEESPKATATVRVRQKWECRSTDLVLYATDRRWVSLDFGLTWEEK